ncbi:MAG TPA: DUF6575 domain-containing protein [Pirellulales bacterium]|jgi:hypothetical protein|nr:DUF6575 domain-containing protein [Pirellulales bacterium]
MAMPSLNGKSVTTPRFAVFKPSKVLYDFDGPRIFTVVDADGELYLAHWCDDDASAVRYLVVPTDWAIIAGVERGELAVRDALEQPRCWVVDVTASGDIEVIRRLDWNDVPPDFPGAMLLPPMSAAPNDVVQLTGRIRKVDKDRLSFDLRRTGAGAVSSTFVFDESLLADVLRALHDDDLVTVVGFPNPTRQLVQATSIRREPAAR